jgi:hypothetical protein
VQAFGNGAVAQVAEALERNLHDPGPEALRDLGGAVRAAGIRHHDLVRPEHARHRVRDLLGFVMGENIGRYLLHIPSLLSGAAHAITAEQRMQEQAG